MLLQLTAAQLGPTSAVGVVINAAVPEEGAGVVAVAGQAVVQPVVRPGPLHHALAGPVAAAQARTRAQVDTHQHPALRVAGPNQLSCLQSNHWNNLRTHQTSSYHS